MTTEAEALRWYAGQVGTQEKPRGSNRQPYAALAGHANGQPWCASFAVAGAHVTGFGLPEGASSAYTPAMESAFKRAGRLFTAPRPGDFFFVYFPSMGRVAHTGVVYAVDGGYVKTIEGNSNDEGSREGYEVCRRRRPIKRALGAVGIRSFGRPLYVAVKPVPAAVSDAAPDLGVDMFLAQCTDTERWYLVGSDGAHYVEDPKDLVPLRKYLRTSQMVQGALEGLDRAIRRVVA